MIPILRFHVKHLCVFQYSHYNMILAYTQKEERPTRLCYTEEKKEWTMPCVRGHTHVKTHDV